MLRYFIRLLALGLGITFIAGIINEDIPTWTAAIAAIFLAIYTGWEE